MRKCRRCWFCQKQSPNAAASTSTTNQRRPYASVGLGQVVMMEPAGNSIYNSLQFTAEKRFIGWSIGNGESYVDADEQDQVESAALYALLERESNGSRVGAVLCHRKRLD